MGNVLQAGIGQAPARQASLAAGIPDTVPCVTVHKVCGSGMRAVMDAGNAIQAGEYEVAVAGGMESMSNAPYLLEKARTGLRMGHGTLVDSMIKDGLWDPYKDTHMGNCAELCVSKYAFTRQEQDAFSLESYKRAQEASKGGALRRRDRGGRGAAEEGRSGQDRLGRGAVRRAAREDADVEAFVPEGRHGDRGQFLEDQRRRRGPRRGLGGEGEGEGLEADRPDRRERRRRPGAGVVHDRAGRGDPEAPRQDRPQSRRRRPVGDQRGLRRRGDGRDPRALAPGRPRQRPRRRGRLGPPDRRLGRADPDDAHPRAPQARRQRGVAAICIGGGEATAMLVEAV